MGLLVNGTSQVACCSFFGVIGLFIAVNQPALIPGKATTAEETEPGERGACRCDEHALIFMLFAHDHE